MGLRSGSGNLRERFFFIHYWIYQNTTRKASLKSLVCASFAVLAGILIFGLWPKDFSDSNNVEWISD